MQATNGTTSKDWEEVDVKEVDNLKTGSNGSKKNAHLLKQASFILYYNLLQT